MDKNNIKALEDAVFDMQQARRDMEFYENDLHFQNKFITALNVYLACLDVCNNDVAELRDAIKVDDTDKAWDTMDSVIGHEFMRIP